MAMNVNHHFVTTLLVGMLIGFMTATYIILSSPEHNWQYLRNIHTDSEEFSYILHKSPIKVCNQIENSTVADHLAKRVRILCLVMTIPTIPQDHEKIMRIKYTWGKRCNTLVFISSSEDAALPTVALPVNETDLWGKTREAFKYVYKHYLYKTDWIVQTNDYTYLVLENLRLMLSNYDESKAVYFEHQSRYNSEEYKTVRTGRILSYEAIRKIVEVGLPNPNLCNVSSSNDEDTELKKCMKAVRVRKGNSLDFFGKNRILTFLPEYYFELGANKRTGCCSNTTISFYDVSVNDIPTLEYFLYHVRPYGIFQYYFKEVPSSADNKSSCTNSSSSKTYNY